MPSSSFRSRPWQTPDDTRLIQDLVRDRMVRDWPAVRFHPGDIDWWAVSAYGRHPGMTDRVRLWFPADPHEPFPGPATPIAYGWFGPPSDLDFVIASDAPAEVAAITAEIVAWGDDRRRAFAAGAIGPLRAWLSSTDATGAAALGAVGLEREDWPGYAHFTGDLSLAEGWPASTLPRGLMVRPLASDADIAARVDCGHAAFPDSTQTIERYRSVWDASLYRPDLDCAIFTGEGRVVAFALGWFDSPTRIVELEPVGVHPEWQRHGLGAEICRATLRAARALGARRAMIAADRTNAAAQGLYASLGLAITADIIPFARPAEAATGIPSATNA